MPHPAFLKVKVKSLVVEAHIIKRDEDKWRKRAQRGRERAERFLADTTVARVRKKSTELYEKASADANSAMEVASAMYHHRTGPLRKESRAAHLAYGFLRGCTYREMERVAYWERHPIYRPKVGINEPNWDRVKKLALTYRGEHSEQVVLQRFAEWRDAAGAGDVRPEKKKSNPGFAWASVTRDDGSIQLTLWDEPTQQRYYSDVHLDPDDRDECFVREKQAMLWRAAGLE